MPPVVLANLGRRPVTDRIAQLVVAPVSRVEWLEVDQIDESERGEDGFGSTGDS